MHRPLDEADVAAADLVDCNGHTTDAHGYHYHANNAAENQVVECLVGQSVAGADDGGGGPPAGDGAARPDGPPPGEG